MNINTFLILILALELLLLALILIIAIATKFCKSFPILHLLSGMILLLVVLVSSSITTITNYTDGYSTKSVTSIKYNEENNTYRVQTVDGMSYDINYWMYSSDIKETELIIDSKITFKTIIGMNLNKVENIMIIRPDVDFENMPVSKRKSYIDELNSTRRILLW